MFDLVIKHGIVVDGSGKPGFRADVAVQGERIAVIGDLGNTPGNAVIDARGKIVSPGWFDLHAHSDTLLLADPFASNKLYQGITTDVSGNCGFSAAPLGKKFLNTWWTDVPRDEKYRLVSWDLGRKLLLRFGVDADWCTLGQYFARLEGRGLAINHCSFVGHNTLRAAAGAECKGGPERVTDEQLQGMKELLAQAMLDGALGFSTEHGVHLGVEIDEDEIRVLCRVAHAYGGLFSNDIRSYGPRFTEAVGEAILTTQAIGIPTTIAHIGARGREHWGKAGPVIRLIEGARSRGAPIVFDQIPMPRRQPAQKLSGLLPGWLGAGAEGSLKAKLENPANRAKLKAEMKRGTTTEGYRADEYPLRGHLWMEVMHILAAKGAEEFSGRSVAQIASQMDADPWDAIVHILARTGGEGSFYLEPQDHEDVCQFMKHPACIGFGTDSTCAEAMARGHRNAESMLRIRSKYSVFPYLIEHYVREYGTLSIEEAIRKLSSAPASFLGLGDRGLLREGMYADLVVFDLETVADRTTPLEIPMPPTQGIEYVIVNGTIVMEHYQHTGNLPGKILRRTARGRVSEG